MFNCPFNIVFLRSARFIIETALVGTFNKEKVLVGAVKNFAKSR